MRSVVWGCNNTACILLQLHQADLFELRSYDTTSKHTEMYEVKHSKFITTCWPANSSREASMGSMCHGSQIMCCLDSRVPRSYSACIPLKQCICRIGSKPDTSCQRSQRQPQLLGIQGWAGLQVS